MTTLRATTKDFLLSEDGALTVDWVVLTAGLVGMCLAAMVIVSGGVEDLSGEISNELVEQDVAAAFASPTPPVAGEIVRISAPVGVTN